MNKKFLLSLGAIAAVVASVAAFSAFEAHVINVTAHIENALAVSPEAIDFGTVFPQEELDEVFTISLSESFMDSGQTRVKDVNYKIVQKPKPLPNDDFGYDALNPWYTFINPTPGDGSDYSITSGVLTITAVPYDDLFGIPDALTGGHNYTAPRMLTGVTGDFTIETKVTAYPSEKYEGAGLLVYQSDGNLVRLELVDYDDSGASSIYMENQKDKDKIGKGWAHHVGLTTVYLRISRTGDTFAGSYSSDGTTWNDVPVTYGTMDNDLLNPQAGVVVVSNGWTNGMFSADFEYFKGGVYKDLCRFLSKLPLDLGEEGDIGVPSYYQGSSCAIPSPEHATGNLDKSIGDTSDVWDVDLKVPPVEGYVGQDWPETCADWTVPHNGLTYGCDLWIEVTGFSLFPVPVID